MNFFNIGFHAGVGGNRTGIGDYMRQLDAAGIPFCVKSTNDVGLAIEAAEYIKRSGVPHHVILRFPEFSDGYPDLPNFNLPPLDAAKDHWNRFLHTVPVEFTPYRHLVWVEPVNEVDTHTHGEWLGEFMYHLGILLLKDGYKGLLSGFNAGQPEPELWKTPGMRAYLELCEDNHDRLGISLHEGKIGDMYAPISTFVPYIIGRFLNLYNACNWMTIKYPKVFITECAWKFDNMPDYNTALRDVRDLAKFYTNVNGDLVEGVFLWNLAGNYSDSLPNKLQKMIEPVTQMALDWDNSLPPSPPQSGYRVVVNLLPQDTTLDEKWYVLKRVHDAKETILQSADDAVELVFNGNSDSIVKVWSPDRWQDDILSWLANRAVNNIEAYSFPTDNPPPPSPSPAPKPFFVKGLDAPASDWRWPVVHSVFDASGLSPKFHTDGIHHEWWGQYKNPQFNLVRIYLNPSFVGDAQAIFDETRGNIDKFYVRGARDFEVWNEPNIENQGIWGQSGTQFGSMFKRVCQMYKAQFPEIRLWFPGMSPGFGAQYQFIDDAIATGAFQYIRGICEHVYTSNSSDINAVNELVAEVGVFRQRYATTRPLVVSEFSHNRPNTAAFKAKVYRDFYLKAKDIPNLLAAYCFTSDWEPNADMNQEGWFKHGIHNEF